MRLKKKNILIGIASLSVILLIGPAVIFPGPELIPDASLVGGHSWSWWTDVFEAKLGAGEWTVTVSQWSLADLEFDIFVTTGLLLLPVSLGSDGRDGVFTSKSVTFVLNESTVVHFRVSESSVYHDSTGYFRIIVSGDGESFDSVFPIGLNLLGMIFLFVGILFTCCCVGNRNAVVRTKSIRREKRQVGYFTPSSQPTRHDESDLTTIRLPTTCPICSADLSDSNIDWTGPMEATCLHCGAVVQAKFERI